MSDPMPPRPSLGARFAAETFGTFLLVFGSISTALFAADAGTGSNGTSLGVGFVGVALAFGITVIVGIYAMGPVSGGHFNPAVTLGLATAGRFAWRDVPVYFIAQVLGGVIGTSLIVLIGTFGPSGWLAAAQEGGFASNGFDEHSPGGFGLGAAITVEIVATLIFVVVILGVTHAGRGPRFPGLAIGLTLTLIHLATIPIDNTSVNPARSIATAVYGGTDPLLQLWVFILFPLVGAVLGGLGYRTIFGGAIKR